MAYDIDNKLVIAIASSALFDLKESDEIFKTKGLEKYKEYQEKNIDKKLEKGVAFPFVERLLSLNTLSPNKPLIEVILLSRNSIETGLRVFRSIEKYGLDISRAAFFSGRSPYKYIPAFNASIFLSANEEDVRAALSEGYPAGRVLGSATIEEKQEDEFRISFDFDGVIAGDESEKVYKEKGIDEYRENERKYASEPLELGPVGGLLKKISNIQKLERKLVLGKSDYKPKLRTSIVTARNAPAHERVITTLKEWGIEVDEAFFMGGIEKKKVLDIMKPHIFFDDQETHLKGLTNVPSVHIPFGVANLKQGE